MGMPTFLVQYMYMWLPQILIEWAFTRIQQNNRQQVRLGFELFLQQKGGKNYILCTSLVAHASILHAASDFLV